MREGRKTFTKLHFLKVSPGGTSYFLIHYQDLILYGYTEVVDAPSKRSFCGVVIESGFIRKYTFFFTNHPQDGSERKGIQI